VGYWQQFYDDDVAPFEVAASRVSAIVAVPFGYGDGRRSGRSAFHYIGSVRVGADSAPAVVPAVGGSLRP